MIYNKRYGFGKIDRDTAPDKRDDTTHFNVQNLETYFTSRGLSLKTANGTGLGISLSQEGDGDFSPAFVVGDAYIEERLFIWVTKNTPTYSSADDDRIYEMVLANDGSFSLDVILSAKLNLRTNQPIDALGYREAENIGKLYWVDGVNQARFINVDEPDSRVDFLLAAGVNGSITAERDPIPASIEAVTRYAFQTYNINGQASKLSAATKPINLSPDNGSAKVTITGLGSAVHDNIRVYRVKYVEYNTVPTLDLIWDSGIPGGTLEFIDTGELFISSVSIEDLLNLGGDLVIPHTLVAKFQHLFFGNLEVDPYEIPADFDTRAYGFATGSPDILLADINGVTTNYNNLFTNVPQGIDAINPVPDVRAFWQNGVNRGAEGANIKLRIIPVYSAEFTTGIRIYKMGEIYRFGVTYKDTYGRWSYASWVCDLKIPYISGQYCNVEVTFNNLPAGANSAKLLVVERTEANKSIVMQGVAQPLMVSTLDGNRRATTNFSNIRGLVPNAAIVPFDIAVPYRDRLDYQNNGTNDTDIELEQSTLASITSPESIRLTKDPSATTIVGVGHVELKTSSSYINFEYSGTLGTTDQTGYDKNVQTDPPGPIYTVPSTTPGILSQDGLPLCLLGSFRVAQTSPNEDRNNRRISYMYQRETSSNITFDNTFPFEEDIADFRFLDFDSAVAMDNGVVVENTVDIINFCNHDLAPGGGQEKEYTNYASEGVSKYIAQMTNPSWDGGSYNNWAKPTDINLTHLPIVDIKRSNLIQYGGNTYEAKTTNIYIDASEPTITGVPIKAFGDTYVGKYAIPFNTGARRETTVRYTSVYDFVYIQLEGSVDPLEYNSALMTGWDASQTISENRLAIESKNWMNYNEVYSTVPNIFINAAKPFNFVDITDYRYRVVPTLVKSAGSTIDPWTEVLTGASLDLEGVYGELIKLVKFKDNVIAFQEKAISYVKIFPTAQTTTATGQVQLGKGAILDEYEVLSAYHGITNIEAVKVYEDDIYFIDAYNKTLNSFTNGEVSRLMGFNTLTDETMNRYGGLLNVDTTTGMFVSLNKKRHEVYFRFSGFVGVLVWNHSAKAFTHTRTYGQAERFISFDNFVYSSFLGNLYQHDVGAIKNYYGADFNAELEMWIEPFPGVDKVFDAVEVLKTGEQFDLIEVTSNTRTSGSQPTNFKSKFDIHTTFLPRVLGSRDRFRERNVRIKLSYTGTADFEVDVVTVKFSLKKP
jgi:hypothetical protein